MRDSQEQRAFNVQYYWAHRNQEIARVRLRQNATLKFLRELRRRPCTDCGETFAPWVMHFDHRDPKTKSFALTTGRSLLMSRANLLEEIAKCDIVCANCHAVRTYAQLLERRGRLSAEQWAPGTSKYIAAKRARWQENVKMLNELRGVPCADCGRQFPPFVMQFDRRDAANKKFEVTRIINRSRKVILEEIAKCDIVCANCHSERTYRRRRGGSAGVAQPG
jgi:formate-dependent nitrite reductase cytochrome c552 subunit